MNASAVGSFDIQVQARIKGSGATYQACKTLSYSVVASLITSVDLTAINESFRGWMKQSVGRMRILPFLLR